MKIQTIDEFDRKYLFTQSIKKTYIPESATIYLTRQDNIICCQGKKALIVSELNARQAEIIICTMLSKFARKGE